MYGTGCSRAQTPRGSAGVPRPGSPAAARQVDREVAARRTAEQRLEPGEPRVESPERAGQRRARGG